VIPLARASWTIMDRSSSLTPPSAHATSTRGTKGSSAIVSGVNPRACNASTSRGWSLSMHRALDVCHRARMCVELCPAVHDPNVESTRLEGRGHAPEVGDRRPSQFLVVSRCVNGEAVRMVRQTPVVSFTMRYRFEDEPPAERSCSSRSAWNQSARSSPGCPPRC
jgi:hypothetical protein